MLFRCSTSLLRESTYFPFRIFLSLFYQVSICLQQPTPPQIHYTMIPRFNDFPLPNFFISAYRSELLIVRSLATKECNSVKNSWRFQCRRVSNATNTRKGRNPVACTSTCIPRTSCPLCEWPRLWPLRWSPGWPWNRDPVGRRGDCSLTKT